jgi:hypothetical protein
MIHRACGKFVPGGSRGGGRILAFTSDLQLLGKEVFTGGYVRVDYMSRTGLMLNIF